MYLYMKSIQEKASIESLLFNSCETRPSDGTVRNNRDLNSRDRIMKNQKEYGHRKRIKP